MAINSGVLEHASWQRRCERHLGEGVAPCSSMAVRAVMGTAARVVTATAAARKH